MKCDSCNKTLIKVDRQTKLAELGEDATDGQMADYFAAELSGDYGAWGIGVIGTTNWHKCQVILPNCECHFMIPNFLTKYFHTTFF